MCKPIIIESVYIPKSLPSSASALSFSEGNNYKTCNVSNNNSSDKQIEVGIPHISTYLQDNYFIAENICNTILKFLLLAQQMFLISIKLYINAESNLRFC